MIIQGRKYELKEVQNNIRTSFMAADMSGDWYIDALRYAIEISDNVRDDKLCSRINKTIGAIAAVSPLKTWEQNKILALQVIRGKRSGTFNFLIKKCELILRSDGSDTEIIKILNGKKIVSFYRNIKQQSNVVTIDRHTIAIALNLEVCNFTISPQVYDKLSDCYINVANEFNINPSLLQSITWTHFRNKNKNNLPF